MKPSIIGLALMGVILTHPAMAQVSPTWQQETEKLQGLGDAACNDDAAFTQLKQMATDGDPVANFFVYRAMSQDKCRQFTSNVRDWNGYLRVAVKASYPDALFHEGKNYLFGYGLEKNRKLAQFYLIKATALGHAEASAELALAYGKGDALPYDRWYALRYLEQAVASGLNDSATQNLIQAFKPEIVAEAQDVAAAARENPVRIQSKRLDFLAQFQPRHRLAQEIASSGAGPAAAGFAQAPVTVAKTNDGNGDGTQPVAVSSDKPAPGTAKFVALAVSHADAVYGFGYEFESREAAETRALEECRSRQGRECDVKVVVRGPGCAAYRYNPGQSVYGWAYSTDRRAAENRAADECSKRNGNKSCQADAWACNERGRDPVEVAVLLEKALPPVQQAISGGCSFSIFMSCFGYPGGGGDKGDRATIFFDSENRRTDMMTCSETHKYERFTYELNKQRWFDYNSESAKQKLAEPAFKSKLDRVREAFVSTAAKQYPACVAPRMLWFNFHQIPTSKIETLAKNEASDRETLFLELDIDPEL